MPIKSRTLCGPTGRSHCRILGLAILVVMAASALQPLRADVPSKPTNVLVRVEGKDEPVVARLVAFDPPQKVAYVLLPTGEMAGAPMDALQETEQVFRPYTFDELGKLLSEEVFRGFKVAQSKRYLYIYNCSDKFRLGTSRILESMYTPLQSYFKREKIKTVDPEFPLVIVIFATHREMRAYREVHESVVAFYEPMSNRVVLTERSRLVEAAPELGIPQAYGTIAHEGVHQILHNIGIQERLSRWPAWVTEGMAEYFAPCEVSQAGTWKGVGKRNDMRMLELTQLPAPDKNRDTITEHTVTARQLTSTGYATAWALTHFLAEKRKKQFMEYIREVSAMKPLEVTDPDEDLVRFKRIFGEDLYKTETGVYQHILSLQQRK